jgi:hypothetical protein
MPGIWKEDRARLPTLPFLATSKSGPMDNNELFRLKVRKISAMAIMQTNSGAENSDFIRLSLNTTTSRLCLSLRVSPQLISHCVNLIFIMEYLVNDPMKASSFGQKKDLG